MPAIRNVPARIVCAISWNTLIRRDIQVSRDVVLTQVVRIAGMARSYKTYSEAATACWVLLS